ncbi:MAG: hypothetical protein LBK75_01795 [Oscillospiraceae bacterium]|jgi:YbbR domain-containing protein|nr:hypothetical protein [Oscillospiraceae bacterium]
MERKKDSKMGRRMIALLLAALMLFVTAPAAWASFIDNADEYAFSPPW